MDAHGDWEPDFDRYAVSYHPTKAEATKAAICGGKKSGIEWLAVTEQVFRVGEWVSVRRWLGDWDNGLDPAYDVLEEATL